MVSRSLTMWTRGCDGARDSTLKETPGVRRAGSVRVCARSARTDLAQTRTEPARLTPGVSFNVESLAPSHPRVHIVKERETIHSIAAQYGLKASAILAANPRVNPRRLRIGESLNLP